MEVCSFIKIIEDCVLHVKGFVDSIAMTHEVNKGKGFIVHLMSYMLGVIKYYRCYEQGVCFMLHTYRLR